jgi:hypothetical protein
VLGGTTDMFNDRIYSTKTPAAALPSDKISVSHGLDVVAGQRLPGRVGS